MTANEARNARLETLGFGAAYLVILVCLAVFWRDIPFKLDIFHYSAFDLREGGIGLGDPTSFATAAVDIYWTGWIDPVHMMIFNIWPPGTALLEAGLMRVFGPYMPILLGLLVSSAVLLAVLLTLVFSILRPALGAVPAFIVGLVPLMFPVTRVFLLQPVGVSLGEPFGVEFFLLGMVLCFEAARRRHIPLAILAGVCLGCAAYFQERFEPFLWAFGVSGAVLIVLAWTGVLGFIFRAKATLPAAATIFIAMVAAQAVMLPWRLFHYAEAGSLAWSFVSDIEYTNALKTTAELEAGGGGFISAGGGNMVCRIDPTTCGDFANAHALFYRTLITHPVEWIGGKAALLGKYWFGPMGYWVGVSVPPALSDVIFNGIIAVLALAALLLPLFLPSLRRQRQWLIAIWFAWTFLASYTAIFVLFHLEARYFYFGKISFLFISAMLLGMIWAERRSAAFDRVATAEGGAATA